MRRCCASFFPFSFLACLEFSLPFFLMKWFCHWRAAWWLNDEKVCVRPLVLNPGPIVSHHHGLRSRQCHSNGQSGQPNGITAVASLIRLQPEHSSSSHSNSRHSIQHEGHQRCLVFGKLPESHHNQPPHCCHYHHQHQQTSYYCSSEMGGHNGGAIRWITARKNFNSVWLPLTTLSAPPSLEIYDSRCQNCRRANDNGYIKNNSNTLLADTKI